MVAKEIARLLTYEATRELQTETKSVQGWAGPVDVDYISGKKVTIVPILRAGLGLMDGVLDMVPGAKINASSVFIAMKKPLSLSNIMSNWQNPSTSELRLFWTRCWLRAAPWSPLLNC